MLNFVVFDHNDILELEVKEKQFFSDTPRGTVKIPLATLQPGRTADMWIPLTESDKKDAVLGGKLHVELTLKQTDADAIAALPKAKRKTAVLASTGTGAASHAPAVGSIKIEDIGDINVVPPEGEFPITADPRGPTPYSFNPATGQFEIPQLHFSGFFVLDRDVTEM